MTLAADVRSRIVGMKEAGATTAEIAVALSVPTRTVNDVFRKFRERGTTTPQNSPGRPPKLGERDLRGLVRFSKKNRRAVLSDVTNSAAVKVSDRTVRRHLRKEGIFARVAVQKPFLTDQHKARRLEFAKVHRNWTVEQWEKVVWTDESSFEIGKNFRRVLVWRTAYERYSDECLVPTFKSGRTSVMIWGAFAGTKKSKLVFMPKDRRTAKDFVDIVYEGELLGFMSGVSGGLLMEDGAPVHRANAPKIWRDLHLMEKLDWPANSPDLNPIENVWAILKNAIQKHSGRPSGMEEMKAALEEEWENIAEESLQKFVHSMPDRMKAVIKAKGGHTRW